MAFNELDLKRIDNCVGAFCRRRARPEVADQLQLVYEVRGQSVVIAEERPYWRDPLMHVRTPVAKLRFVRASGRPRGSFALAPTGCHNEPIRL